jgi:antitoxin component YwqK of YwqJK toxin-antitoxin module
MNGKGLKKRKILAVFFKKNQKNNFVFRLFLSCNEFSNLYYKKHSMSELKLLLICLLFLGNCFARFDVSVSSQYEGINQRDQQGKKQGKWIYFGKDRPEEGYPSEGKIEEGFYKDDRKEGVWIKYYNDGETPKLKGFYINNRPQGEFVKIYPNGKVKEKGSFFKNSYQDSLKRYYENGQLEYEAFYSQSGKENGVVRYYFPNGQLEFEYTASEGVPTGVATRYFENGDVNEQLVYGSDGAVEKSQDYEMVNPAKKVKDPGAVVQVAPKVVNPKTKGITFEPNGYNKIYNANDEIWQDGTFKNGQLWDGKVYEYDKDGILLKVEIFKNGNYHSDGQL